MKKGLARFYLKIFSLVTRNLSLSKKYLDEINLQRNEEEVFSWLIDWLESKIHCTISVSKLLIF